ncbi:hypothetical protein Mnod_7558 [Methylobacterium nodulans ORS 2060]|uniref:Uncharacterized protein n=1 Tax=Methylobacterium nodulans (strain LMG 21967 / CNCM I-2342 / ORS 2060) TaxID=460265 RepID=B8IPK2_METNO|nr:hypothetical protein Mnod_7558 [Methylobacterium nodulans ORS 2060]
MLHCGKSLRLLWSDDISAATAVACGDASRFMGQISLD